MANRYRNNGIYLMLSDDELEILNKKYELSSCKTPGTWARPGARRRRRRPAWGS